MATIKPPSKTVTTGATAGALVVVIVWIVHQFAHIDLPAEVATALGVIISGLAAWIQPDPARRVPDHEPEH